MFGNVYLPPGMIQKYHLQDACKFNLLSFNSPLSPILFFFVTTLFVQGLQISHRNVLPLTTVNPKRPLFLFGFKNCPVHTQRIKSNSHASDPIQSGVCSFLFDVVLFAEFVCGYLQSFLYVQSGNRAKIIFQCPVVSVKERKQSLCMKSQYDMIYEAFQYLQDKHLIFFLICSLPRGVFLFNV